MNGPRTVRNANDEFKCTIDQPSSLNLVLSGIMRKYIVLQRFGRALSILAGSAIAITAGCIFDDKPIPKPAPPPADVAKPAATADVKPQTSEASNDETSTEAPFQLEAGFTALSLDQFDAFGAEPETW
jgi:hypothetical protein